MQTASKRVSLAQRVDDALDFNDLKRRVRDALSSIETQLNVSGNVHFVDAQTDTNPAQYQQGDVIVDSSVTAGAIVIYAYDAKKNKIPLSFKSLTGSLPISLNEVFIGNGATTTFNTQISFIKGSTAVYKAGLRQRINVDYTENAASLKQIIFAAAPANAAVIIIDYEMSVSL